MFSLATLILRGAGRPVPADSDSPSPMLGHLDVVGMLSTVSWAREARRPAM